MANCWTSARDFYKDAVANSATFQAMVETPGDETAAAAFVFGAALPPPADGNKYTRPELEGLRHYAQIYSGDETPYGKRRRVFGNFEPFGQVQLVLSRLVTEAELDAAYGQLATVAENYELTAGDILDEVLAWLDANGGPWVQTAAVSDGPGFVTEEEAIGEGLWMGIEFTISWGRTDSEGGAQ